MKQISIIIEDYAHFSREQVVETFQKFVFSKGIRWISDNTQELRYLEGEAFTIQEHEGRLTLGGCYFDGDTSFTYPSQHKEFEEYLDKYMSYHKKPAPKEGKLYRYGKHVVRIVENKSGSRIIIEYCDGKQEAVLHKEDLRRSATKEESISFEWVVQQRKEREETALIEEAERRYAAGTEFISPSSDIAYKSTGKFQIYKGSVLTQGNPHEGFVYDAGQWGKIIEAESENQEPISYKERIKELEEALKESSKTISKLQHLAGNPKVFGFTSTMFEGNVRIFTNYRLLNKKQ